MNVELSRLPKRFGHPHVLEPDSRTNEGAGNFAWHLLTKAAERLRGGDYYWRRLVVHLSWVGDPSGWWDEINFSSTIERVANLSRAQRASCTRCARLSLCGSPA